jgi:hypothetical protein
VRFVGTRLAPYVAEDFDREVLGDLSAVRDARDQAEHESMRALVELAQRPLIAGGNVVDEHDPVAFGEGAVVGGAVAIQHVAQRCRRKRGGAQ